MKNKLAQIISFLRRFFVSKYFMVFIFGLACLITAFRLEVAGAIAFVLLVSLILVVSDDFIAVVLPILLMSEFLCKMYDSFNTFIKFWPLVIVVVCSFVFHMLKYGGKAPHGSTFKGLVAVSIAVTLGGLFTKGALENFNPAGIYHIIGLGWGMVVLYLIMNTQISAKREYDLKVKFSYIMMLMGMFASFMVFQHYLMVINELGVIDKVVTFQWKNNISTFLMIAMPFPFYLSAKSKSGEFTFHRFWIGILLYAAILLSPSRGGYVFGTIEFAFCLIYILAVDKKNRRKNIFSIVACGAVVLLIAFSSQDFVKSIFGNVKINKGEDRILLYGRAIKDFLRNPIFGTGLCYSGNEDIWKPAKFAICWYNCSIFQILGSLGLVGVAAYGYQLFEQLKTIFRVFSKFNLAVFISFLGLSTMSLVNPGIFSPIPYVLILTMQFIIVDKCNNKEFEDNSTLKEYSFKFHKH